MYFKRLGKVFAEILKAVMAILFFVVNHDKIFTRFMQIGAKALLQPAETRHAGKFLAALSIQEDERALKALFLDDE
jgi:hypothetical protein